MNGDKRENARFPSRMAIDSTKQHNRRDSLGRRSRFARSPAGKRLMLGKRDVEIMRWLYRYRYLRQTHLQALLNPVSPKRLVERLGDLFHETGLINRPTFQAGSFDLRASPTLYEITASGIEWLSTQNSLPHRAVTFSHRSRRSYSPQILHTMMIIEALLAIERTTLKTRGQRFVPVDEVLERAPASTRLARNPLAVPVILESGSKKSPVRKRRQTMLIPDALYGIEYLIDGEKRYRFWALECERTSPAWRSSVDASSTSRKRAAYDALIAVHAYRTQWGIPNLKLHLIAAGAEAGVEVMRDPSG
ncbi:replication-relaxation family protein [Mesorhizobium sp. 10J20-29]